MSMVGRESRLLFSKLQQTVILNVRRMTSTFTSKDCAQNFREFVSNEFYDFPELTQKSLILNTRIINYNFNLLHSELQLN